MDGKFEIRELRRRDHNRIIRDSIVGMHHDVYFKSKWATRLFARFFFYQDLEDTTDALVACEDGRAVGALLVAVVGRRKKYRSLFRRIYIKLFVFFMRRLGGKNNYAATNGKMFHRYRKKYRPDCEIKFFVVHDSLTGHGIGTRLLNEMFGPEADQEVFVFTDAECSYSFYDCKGFERFAQENVTFSGEEGDYTLECYLYRKHIQGLFA